ncbi:MAG: hypothetical protein AAF039_14895 [Bacteroidota bacterium]
MHGHLSYLFAFLLLFGCRKDVEKKDLAKLNGYWEISEVQFPNGQVKSYTISTMVDFIAIEGMSGFRKKMKPQFNGSFITSDDAESFDIVEKNGIFYFSYGRGMQQREEILLELTQNTFAVKNTNDVAYHYKRYEPITINP